MCRFRNLCNIGDNKIFDFYNLEICNTVCDALPKERNFGTKPVKFVIVGQCETCLIDTEKISEEVKSAVVGNIN